MASVSMTIPFNLVPFGTRKANVQEKTCVDPISPND
jgi:hypothetical protein